MTFDAISSYQQLMLAAGKEGFPPVPNTLENALKDENTRIVVTTAEVRRGGQTDRNETMRGVRQHHATISDACCGLLLHLFLLLLLLLRVGGDTSQGGRFAG